MRIITYNIRKGKGASGRDQVSMQRLGEALTGHGSDLVLCQEVFHPQQQENGQSHHLADSLGLNHFYGANKFRRVGHHGNTTLTHLPVEHSENHDLSTNRVERRGALYVRLRMESRALHVFNVHLGLNRWQRAHQIERLAAIMDRVCSPDDPVILAGDFNDWRSVLDERVTTGLGFHNAFRDCQPQEVRTYPAGRPLLSLDRIYLRNLTTKAVGRLQGDPWTRLSDHLPLWAELGRD